MAIKAAQLRQQELAQYTTNKKLKGIEDSADDNLNGLSPDKLVKQDKNGNKFESIDRGSSIEEYGRQYDPNNDFAIFNIGDKTKGGIQSLKEKMNLADDVENEELSEDENRIVPNSKTLSESNKNSNSPVNSNCDY